MMNDLQQVMCILKKIGDIEIPGKKTVQKLFYLIERRGVNLSLNYSIHFFGPYSSALDNKLIALQNYGAIQINTKHRFHKIKVMDSLQTSTEIFSAKDIREIDFVIGNFAKKTPLELEALTTLDFVYNNLTRSKDEKEIIDIVLDIKGTKFKESFLKEQLKTLKESGFAS